jgi:uncharacterized protein (TIGR02466 family)
MKILNLFPTNILGVVLNEITDQELKDFKKYILNSNLQKDEGNTSKLTINQQLLNNDLFTKLNQQIIKYSKIYLNKIGHIYEDLQISNSWANIVNPGGHLSLHKHVNSYISGSFYFSESSEIEFFNPLHEKWIFTSSSSSKNIFYKIKPISKLLLLFPSFIDHRVINSKNNRVSIAFNIIPKGKFGLIAGELNL